MHFPKQVAKSMKFDASRGGITSYVLHIIFLVPIFIHTFQIGGQAYFDDIYNTYDDTQRISIYALFYLTNAILFIYSLSRKDGLYYTLLLTAILLLILFFQLGMVDSVFNIDKFTYVLPAVRGILWVTSTFAFAFFIYKKDVFLNSFFYFSYFSCIFCLFCMALYSVTNVPFGISVAYGFPRAQGLLSEPSAISIFVPSFIIISYIRKDYIAMLVGLATLLAASSAIGYIVFCLMVIVYLSRFIRFDNYVFAALCCSPLIVVSLIFSPVNDFFITVLTFISDILRGLSFDAGNYNSQGDRIVSALVQLPNIIQLTDPRALSSVGDLARIASPIFMSNFLFNNDLIYIGTGPSVFGAVALDLFRVVLDSGFVFYAISSYGIFIATLLVFMMIRMYIRLNNDLVIKVIYAGATIAVLFNSAAGINGYTIALFFVIYQFKPEKLCANSN